MLQPTKKKQTAKTTSVPAPIGGLNARDSIAAMPPTDAVILDNYNANPTSCDVRNGYTPWVTGITGWVETIAHYNGAVTKKLFAAANSSSIYDVTSSGAVGAAVVTGLTNTRFQCVNFANAGSNWLYMVNGADKPRLYDGATWTAIDGVSAPAITGVTTTNLIHVWAFKQRLWFTEKDSTKIWYLPVQSVGGAAQSIDFGSLFRLGGYLMGMTSFSVDDSNGMDDYAAFVSSEGEVLVYKGYDPSSVSTWALVSQFRIGRPIGRRFFTKIGSDVAMITADGITQMSKAMLTDRSQLQGLISYKIVNSITADVQTYAANFGWQIILYPIGNKLIVNVPVAENSSQFQYVMNTISTGWSTYGKYNSPWNAACFEYFNDDLYFGGNGVVNQCDVTNDDNSLPIVGLVSPASQYFGELGREKYFTLARPIFFADGAITPSIVLNVDFDTNVPIAVNTYTVSGSLWNVSPWNTTPWGGSSQVRKNWLTVNGLGYAASLAIKTSTKGMTLKLQSIDYVYEYGGVL